MRLLLDDMNSNDGRPGLANFGAKAFLDENITPGPLLMISVDRINGLIGLWHS